ncbi:MAG: hypothetical protein QM601_09645 [Pseudoxanthomonas sp.]
MLTKQDLANRRDVSADAVDVVYPGQDNAAPSIRGIAAAGSQARAFATGVQYLCRGRCGSGD